MTDYAYHDTVLGNDNWHNTNMIVVKDVDHALDARRAGTKVPSSNHASPIEIDIDGSLRSGHPVHNECHGRLIRLAADESLLDCDLRPCAYRRSKENRLDGRDGSCGRRSTVFSSNL